MSRLKTPTDKVFLNKVTHTVRTAQAVLQYGVGAMVDFPDQTLMTAAPEYWDDKIIHIHDERLENDMWILACRGRTSFGKEYLTCVFLVLKCRRFQPLVKWVKNTGIKPRRSRKSNHMKRPRCLECRKIWWFLEWFVCLQGHIDDFLGFNGFTERTAAERSKYVLIRVNI